MRLLSALRDFSRKHQLAASMFDNLRRFGRPGGIDVTRLDTEGVAALMHLLQTKPEVTVVKHKHAVTLMLKEDLHLQFTPAIAASMARGGILATPTDDLLHEEP